MLCHTSGQFIAHPQMAASSWGILVYLKNLYFFWQVGEYCGPCSSSAQAMNKEHLILPFPLLSGRPSCIPPLISLLQSGVFLCPKYHSMVPNHSTISLDLSCNAMQCVFRVFELNQKESLAHLDLYTTTKCSVQSSVNSRQICSSAWPLTRRGCPIDIRPSTD